MKKTPVGFGHKKGVLGSKKMVLKLMDCKDMCFQQKWCRSISWCSNDEAKKEDDECQLYTEVPTVEYHPDTPPLPPTCAYHYTSCGKTYANFTYMICGGNKKLRKRHVVIQYK